MEVGQFLFSTPCYRVSAAGVCLTHLFKHKHLFVYLVLYELHLTLVTVGDKLKGTLRYNYHIPIVVLDFCIEILSTFRIAVIIFKRKYLGIWIEFLS